MKIRGLIAALAVAFSPFMSSAATVTSSGVVGGCDVAIAGGVGQIDVFGGASWNATFSNGDAGGTCLFDLNNSSASAIAVTIAVATVNQGGSFWGFLGGTSLSSGTNHFATWNLAQGVGGIINLNFNIAAGGLAFFDWSWGQAYASGSAMPEIDFNVFATAIPVPAASFLLLGGLGALVAFGRRKKLV